MNKFLTLAAISCTIIALSACSDDVTNVTENNVGVQSFESFQKLPDCTKDNQGEMAIAKEEGLVYYCDDKEWKKLNGEPGENGSNGKGGADGGPGKDGKNGIDGVNGKDGSDGKDGNPGTSCIANKLKNGIEIVCDGIVVDTLKNGEKGEPGAVGINGTNCSGEKISDGIKITCGDGFEEVLTNGKDGNPGDKGLDGTGCTLEDNKDGTVTVQCGESELTTLSKAICGISPYDPAKQFCDTRDYNIYNYAKIGSQIWMAENLKYRAINKDANPLSDSGSYCFNDYYNSDPESFYCEKYGRMYTWASAMGKSEDECGYGKECGVEEFPHQGVCPNGWHLPTKEEVIALLNYVKDDRKLTSDDSIAYYLKSTSGWAASRNGIDFYGFNGIVSPYRSHEGSLLFYEQNLYFWTATEDNNALAFMWQFTYSNEKVYYEPPTDKKYAYSVRCVMN